MRHRRIVFRCFVLDLLSSHLLVFFNFVHLIHELWDIKITLNQVIAKKNWQSVNINADYRAYFQCQHIKILCLAVPCLWAFAPRFTILKNKLGPFCCLYYESFDFLLGQVNMISLHRTLASLENLPAVQKRLHPPERQTDDDLSFVTLVRRNRSAVRPLFGARGGPGVTESKKHGYF